jgi:hypothetical protein
VVVSHGFLRVQLRKEGYAHQQPVAVTASTARFESRCSRLPVSTQQPRLEAVEAYTKGACALPGFGLRPGWRRPIPFLALTNVVQSPETQPPAGEIDGTTPDRHASQNGSGYLMEGPSGLESDDRSAPVGACMWLLAPRAAG